jgi:hypothetical protein
MAGSTAAKHKANAIVVVHLMEDLTKSFSHGRAEGEDVGWKRLLGIHP